LQDFTYSKPGTLEQAVAAYEHSGDGLYLAGGQTMIPVMKQGLAMPEDVIDLGGIGGLAGIDVDPSSVTIGAMTRHADVASSPQIRGVLPALAKLAGGIGDPQVRNRGTLGGSLANNDPTADYPAAVLALGATVHTNRREITADDFFQGLFETALDEGEIITQVTFPVPQKAAYAKFPNPASRYAIAGVFVAQLADTTRVAVTGAGNGVFRVLEMEAALIKNFTTAALDGITVPTGDLMSDMHASAEYRAHLIMVMTRRAVEAASRSPRLQGGWTAAGS
jgi:carbon-monoxide dehydrogenase medium subunit